MDFTDAELSAMKLMRQAARTMPDDVFAVGALQEMACLYAKIEPLLSDDMKATFIGAGAYVAQQAEAEMKAQIMAFTKLAELRNPPPPTKADSDGGGA